MKRKFVVATVLVVVLLSAGIAAALTHSNAASSGSDTYTLADAEDYVHAACGFDVVKVVQGKYGYTTLQSAEHESNMSPGLKAEMERDGYSTTTYDVALWDGNDLVWCPNSKSHVAARDHQAAYWDGLTLRFEDGTTVVPTEK